MTRQDRLKVRIPCTRRAEERRKRSERIIRQKAAFELALKAKTKTPRARARPTERREAGWVNHQSWERRKEKHQGLSHPQTKRGAPLSSADAVT